VVFDARRGLIITNSHVIDHANEITVKLTDGRALPARRVGADSETEVAVIQVRADVLTELPFGNTDRLEVGDFVFAIGNPQKIGQTVTAGIVSGLHRANVGLGAYEDFIHTDDAADLQLRLALLRIGEVTEFAVSRPGGAVTVRAAMAEREPAARSK
jgi:S1-C subfamily serine protease